MELHRQNRIGNIIATIQISFSLHQVQDLHKVNANMLQSI